MAKRLVSEEVLNVNKLSEHYACKCFYLKKYNLIIKIVKQYFHQFNTSTVRFFINKNDRIFCILKRKNLSPPYGWRIIYCPMVDSNPA
jgi:23S rRNA U2552 (ribose-2'-O)-methylase RlmE/FtsJ